VRKTEREEKKRERMKGIAHTNPLCERGLSLYWPNRVNLSCTRPCQDQQGPRRGHPSDYTAANPPSRSLNGSRWKLGNWSVPQETKCQLPQGQLICASNRPWQVSRCMVVCVYVCVCVRVCVRGSCNHEVQHKASI
jgi:hypothetical protein